MLVWARNEQRRLVRVIPQRHYEESIVGHLFQENPTPQMDHPGNQQTLFNPNAQGLPGDPQSPHEPPRQGDGVAPPMLRPYNVYKFMTLLPEDYCLIPGNGAIKLVGS